ncbi:MAG TPA: alpha/beta hydrolase [Burkholderiaceae bacterium]|nr:alpha/beta hydrolase [Burkholderiaceae bacterium]
MTEIYRPRRESASEFVEARRLRHHVRRWGDPAAPPILMLHGWMDVSASFQFVVDALARERHVIAPDWRGFGLTDCPGADCYWFPDYLGDLDALLDALLPPRQAVDVVAHSMGGNVAMLYAGVRPERVRTLVNLEGFGMPASDPAEAPDRMRQWLDELRDEARVRDYPSRDAVAERLVRTNPRLPLDKARWLAGHWSRRTAAGRFELLGDPAHKRVNPYPYRVDEVVAAWRRIAAPVMLVASTDGLERHRFVETDEYRQRLAAVPRLSRATVGQAGHMLHHDRPDRVAALIEEFVDG